MTRISCTETFKAVAMLSLSIPVHHPDPRRLVRTITMMITTGILCPIPPPPHYNHLQNVLCVTAELGYFV